jgi:DNA polymerase-1
MEEAGIRIDTDVLAHQSEELEEKLEKLEYKAHELAGEEFNLGSPKQLQHIFYEKLGFETYRRNMLVPVDDR